MSPAIRVEGVGKRYRLLRHHPTLVGSVASLVRRRASEELWALRDINLVCEPGETLGIIGRNGSGKTTLLRLLAGVSAPTVGRVRVEGRVAPLIGIGVGFDNELTGRENVSTNAQMLGLSPAAIRRRFDEIVEFSEMGAFLDTAVKYYSSGMFLRLAFAIAVHVEPQILLADELLAVGDVAFQAKCMERMQHLRETGTTIVLVTHNLDTVQRVSARTIVLHNGNLVFEGTPEDAIGTYHQILHDDHSALGAPTGQGTEGVVPADAGSVRVSFAIVDESGRTTHRLEPGEPWIIRLRAEFDREVVDPSIAMSISQLGRGLVYANYTGPGDYRGDHGPDRPLEGDIRLANPLLAGTYIVQVQVRGSDTTTILGIATPQHVYLSSMRRDVGLVDMAATFEIGGSRVVVSERPNLRSLGS